ncbi:MAG: RNA 2',3'-cyclic phosphodiesterase [Pseudomonadota bacterium]
MTHRAGTSGERTLPGATLDEGADLSPQSRWFFALWPPAPVREALAQQQARWTWPRRARLVPAGRLHLTLHFLGAMEPPRRALLMSLPAVPFEPFEFAIERAGRWRGIAWMGPGEVPLPLLALQAALGQQLRERGFELEERPYAAHVTLAREAAQAGEPGVIDPVQWTVREYVLAASVPGERRDYVVLRRFPASSGGAASVR